MKHTITILSILYISLGGFQALSAQPAYSFVDADAVRGFDVVNGDKCDFSKNGQVGPFHIMLLGDSVGALLGVYPGGVVAFRAGAIANKRWEQFMTSPAPEGMPSWRVLNLAVSGVPSWVLLNALEGCIGAGKNKKDNLPETREERFRRSTPHRVWLEIGGNDLLQFYGTGIWQLNPHYANYHLNSILNKVGRIITLLQQQGRTVLISGYHSKRARNVKFDLKEINRARRFNDLTDLICGADQKTVVVKQTFDLACLATGGALKLFKEFSDPYVRSIAKLRQSMKRYLGFEYMDAFQANIFGKAMYPYLRKLDNTLGRLFGLNRSFTGLFEDPAEILRKNKGDLISDFMGSLKKGMPWQQFWDLIQSIPRGEVGWAVQFALPNREKAISATITYIGRRYQENYKAQGVPIPGTNRRTVEYISLEPYFRDPFVEWGSRNELMADAVHPNNAGAAIYGRVMAQKFKELQYDLYGSDYDFTTNNWRDWTPLPEDPTGDDLQLLLLCFFFGYCQ